MDLIPGDFDDSEFSAAVISGEPVPKTVDDTFVAARLLDDLVEDDVAINRRTVRRAFHVCTVLEHVRRHPEVYTVGDGRDDLDHSVRAVVFDISLRLRIPEDMVRGLQCTARTARESLPLVWDRAWEGFAGIRFVEAAVSAVLRLRAPVGADAAAEEYAAEAIGVIDRACAEWVLTLSLAAFRRRVRTLVARLDPAPAEEQHARGMTDRRVVFEDAGDGMSWIMALAPTVKALAIKRRLTASAKHVQQNRRDGRTRDQVRADLFCDWLTGAGTATAVKTKIFVTVPIGLLTGTGCACGPAAGASFGASATGTATETGTAAGASFGAAAVADATTTPGTATMAGAAPANGTATAANTATTGVDAGHPAPLPGEILNPLTSLTQAHLVGHGPIDPATARQLFFDATGFRRVITDPVHGFIRDMDRRTYQPTNTQRDWLILQHGTCARDGCTRLAIDADLDHEHAWAHEGPTNLDNLRPLCPADHARNHHTRIRYHSRTDRTVQATTPTGFHTDAPPPF